VFIILIFKSMNFYCCQCPDCPDGPEVLEVLEVLVVLWSGDLLTGSWQDAECECLLELLTALKSGQELLVLLGGTNILRCTIVFNFGFGGRNRQIRRMCELVGMHVMDLVRIRIGKPALGACRRAGGGC